MPIPTTTLRTIAAMTATRRALPLPLLNRQRFSLAQHRYESSPDLSTIQRPRKDFSDWSESSSDSEGPHTPTTAASSNTEDAYLENEQFAKVDVTRTKGTKATTKLITQSGQLAEEQSHDANGGGTHFLNYCCGGGCWLSKVPRPLPSSEGFEPFVLPDNNAFRALGLKLDTFSKNDKLSKTTALPPTTITLTNNAPKTSEPHPVVYKHPPPFVKPHPPYDVFSAPVFHARELTKPGAAKRTFHFDIDVTDYPVEGDVDFKVGGAVGICPPNNAEAVDELLDVLGVPKFLRDKPVVLKTQGGRWPTIWGDEEARELITTRRELLTWCSDIQSYPPTKQILRLLAEYATDHDEKHLLLFLVSAQGQSVFCDLRTGPHITISQLLNAFPSSKPPLPALLSVLNQLMPRFYSLSNDPHVSSDREGLAGRRLIEVAVTVHDSRDWRGGMRTGLGSGHLENIAQEFIEAEANGTLAEADLRIPLFRGLMANPLSKEFSRSDGPMMLIGAGVGMAPFRGFILNRLRNANCASKIWLVQGVRDSNLDELYSGELGQYEAQIKKVVQSRARRGLGAAQRGHSEGDLAALRLKKGDAASEREHWKAADNDSKYVQDEVRQQADVVWEVIQNVDGKVFVCGSSAGMGEGVEQALRDVVKLKGGFTDEGAKEFWIEMKAAGRYIAETW